MKRTKRQKNAIVVGVIFNILLLIGLSYYSVFSLKGQVESYEQMKQDTLLVVRDIEKINKNGLSFIEFKRKTPSNPDSYLKEVLSKVDSEFYDEYFINTQESTYNEFIDNYDAFGDGSKDSIEEIEKVLDTVIPSYTTFNKSILHNSGALTEFKFINHIEQLLYTFSLDYKGFIGIGSIVPYESPQERIKKTSDLDENIFSIPFEFTVEGEKSNIIDFIHYLENVGNIVYDENGIGLEGDKFIKDRFGRTKVLEGENRVSGYNIYAHQFADISGIEFKEYPYGSDISEKYSSGNLFAYIRDVQGTEEFSATISTNFYVKGIPSYEMMDEIENFLGKYDSLKKKVIKVLKDKRATRARDLDAVSYFDKMGALNIYIESLAKDINRIKKTYRKKENLSDIYKEVIKMSEIIRKSELIYNNPKYVTEEEI